MAVGDTDITIAKVELPLDKADSSRIADALIDLFSPITNVAGLLGDRIKLFRARSVIGVLAETRRLAAEHSYQLSEPALKFLIPLVGGASKEDPEDQEFRSLWANLLMQASLDHEKAHPLLVETLTRLTTMDAAAMEMIVRNPRYVGRSINQIQDAAFLFDKWDPVASYVDEILLETDEQAAVSALIERAEDRGTIVTSCGFYSFGRGW